MFRVVRTAALLAVLASLLALPAAATASSAQKRMLDRVNAVRAHHGLKPLRFAKSLSQSAARYSHTMMSRDYFGHGSRIHASRRFRSLGEILEIHRGKRIGIGRALRQWMHSPGHRSVILSSHFRFAGAGFSRGSFQGRGATIWVMHFGRR